MGRISGVATILLLNLVFTAIAHANSLILWNRNYDTAPVDAFVSLALTKTSEFGTTTLQKSIPLEQDQAIEALASNRLIDIMSAAAATSTEEKLRAIRVPILKGLLGHRICLIRKGDQARFDKIQTAFDFITKNIKICQGEHWPDTKVLIRNGLKVSTSPIYSNLFNDLKNGTCDCFLRGAQEILPEFNKYRDTLDLERRIVIFYNQPGIIYVNKDSISLAARLELGLLRALDDGSFDQLIDALMGEAIEELALSERHYIRLNNPFISNHIRELSRAEALWY